MALCLAKWRFPATESAGQRPVMWNRVLQPGCRGRGSQEPGEVRSWGLALNKGGFLFFFFLIFLKGKQKPHEPNKGDNFKIQTAQTRKESRAEGDTTARPGCGPRPTQKQRASPHFTKTEQSTLLSWHAEVPYLRKLSQTSLC